MDFFLRWILPPLTGAVIGYITNALAIKMLFRPLTEKRFFGLRIPFTPGILPRERHALAVSLGDVVAEDLLTGDVLRSRLESREVTGSVEASVRSILDDFLDSPVRDLRAAARGANPLLSEAADRAYRSVTAADAFRNAAAAAIREGIGKARDLRMDDILKPSGKSLLAEWFRRPGSTEDTAERVSGAVLAGLRRAAGEGKSLGDVLPLQDLHRMAASLFDAGYPAALTAVHSFLARPDVRKELERYGSLIVRRAIGRLPPLQRLFVNAAQYEKALVSSMPSTVLDLAESVESFLSSDATRERLRSALNDAVRQAVDSPLAARPEGHSLSPEGLAELARRAVKALGDRQTAEGTQAAPLGGITLGELLDALGPDARGGLSEALGAWIAGLFAPGTGGQVVATVAAAFSRFLMDGLGETPLGTAAGWDAAFRDRLARYLAGQGVRIAARESARILAGLDLRKIVTDKVDALDILAIERIMLRVMAKEFKGITALGGVLGALIGAFQLLVDLVRP